MRASTILVPFLVFLSGVGSAAAQELSLQFRDGLVRLTANNVPASRILDEWTRLGGTRIVNAERVPGAPLTLQLIDVPERQALDTVLRGAAGYMVAARETPVAGASAFDTIFVLPTTTGVLATSSVTPPQQPLGLVGVPLGQVPTAGLNRPANAPQGPVDDAVEDDDEPEPDEQAPPEPVGAPRGQTPTAGLTPPANVPSRVPVDDAVEDDDELPDTGPPAPAPASAAPRKPSGVAPGAARPGVPPPPVSRDPRSLFPTFPGIPR